MHRCHCSCCCIRGQVTVIDQMFLVCMRQKLQSQSYQISGGPLTADKLPNSRGFTKSNMLAHIRTLSSAFHKPLQSQFSLLLSVLMIQDGCCADVHPSTGHQSTTACLLVSPLIFCSLPELHLSQMVGVSLQRCSQEPRNLQIHQRHSLWQMCPTPFVTSTSLIS